MAEVVPSRRPPGEPSLLHPGPAIRVTAVSGAEWVVADAAGDLTVRSLKEELQKLAGVDVDEQVLLVQHLELEDHECVRAGLSAAQAQTVTLVRMPPAVVETTLSCLQAAAAELPVFLRDLTLTVIGDHAADEADSAGQTGGQGLQLPLPLGLRALTLRLDRDAAEECLAALGAWRPRCLRDLHVEVDRMPPAALAALTLWLGSLADGLQGLHLGHPPDGAVRGSRRPDDPIGHYDLVPLLRSLPASLRSLRLDPMHPHYAAFRVADLGLLPAGLRSLHLHLIFDWSAEAVALLPPGLEVLGCAPAFAFREDLPRFMHLLREGCRPRSLQELCLMERRTGGHFMVYVPDTEAVAAAAPPGVRARLVRGSH